MKLASGYRREIDGLRAIAVLPVVLFHAGLKQLSGGYAGVDVFFVISGYLITQLLASDLERGRFSLLDFYERRARRILPALFFVILLTLPMAWRWMLPSELESFARSILSVTTFVSNIYFWQTVKYFDNFADQWPLLHTWSLSVEEQYYLLFPLALALLWKLRRSAVLPILTAAAIASLILSQWAVHAKPMVAYYLLPARAFELLAGACLALSKDQPFMRRLTTTENAGLRNIISAFGLVLLGFTFLVFDSETAFPGINAMIPVLGTLCIIAAARPDTVAGKILASRPCVAIGLISYSLYLWHQPLFAFARIRSINEPSMVLMLSLAALAIPLSALTWRFVEQPFRNRNSMGRSMIFSASASASLAAVAVSLAALWTGGFQSRTTADGESLASLNAAVAPNFGLGANASECTTQFTLSAACRTGAEPEVVIWGDSYAEHHVTGIIAALPGTQVVQMTKNACGPFAGLAPLGTRELGPDFARRCLAFNADVLHWILSTPGIRYAILSSSFLLYTDVVDQYLTPEGPVPAEPHRIARALDETIKMLESKGIKTVIIGPPPLSPQNIGKAWVRGRIFGLPQHSLEFPLSEADKAQATVNRLVQDIAAHHTVIDLKPIICPGGTCRPMIDGKLLYFDQGHLTRYGSRWVAEQIDYRKLLQGP